jgi:hypothetical protein
MAHPVCKVIGGGGARAGRKGESQSVGVCHFVADDRMMHKV